MKVIGEQGDNVFLLLVGEDMARVLDMYQGKLFPPFNVHSILARGYWEEFHGDEKNILKLMRQVEVLPDRPVEQDTLCIKVMSTESNIHLATIESRYGKVRMWENVEPLLTHRDTTDVVARGSDEVLTLIPTAVELGGRAFSREDGDDFLYALACHRPWAKVAFEKVGAAWLEQEQRVNRWMTRFCLQDC